LNSKVFQQAIDDWNNIDEGTELFGMKIENLQQATTWKWTVSFSGTKASAEIIELIK